MKENFKKESPFLGLEGSGGGLGFLAGIGVPGLPPGIFTEGNIDYISATFDSNSNKVVVAYTDYANSNYGTAAVGEVSGTDITFGSSVVFNSATTYYISATFDSNSNKVVISYQDRGNNWYGTSIVGTVSGTDISFGSSSTFNSGATSWIGSTFDTNSNKVVVAYRDNDNSGKGTAAVGTVSGTSISFGSEYIFNNANTYYATPVFDSSNNKVVIVYQDAGNSYVGHVIVGTVSGSGISFGSEYNFTGSETNHIAATYTTGGKTVVAYRANSTYGTARVISISGNSVSSFGSESTFESASTYQISATYDSSSSKVIVGYTDLDNSSYGTYAEGTISGTSISFASPVVFESASTNITSATYDSSNNKPVLCYKSGGKGKAAVL